MLRLGGPQVLSTRGAQRPERARAVLADLVVADVQRSGDEGVRFDERSLQGAVRCRVQPYFVPLALRRGEPVRRRGYQIWKNARAVRVVVSATAPTSSPRHSATAVSTCTRLAGSLRRVFGFGRIVRGIR